ncbi:MULTISPECIES: deoxyribodipyrimidine photo-lyase [unclassified Massilia]|uniref:cryptochrome/photolyase family protein n=1 Tax=unclassified Massilia TaxID=2609279 RepID=UPI00177FB628|nr:MULTISPECIES: deoxyribodipyrimidine photo-lyase [unclassified Massilia]MBD8530855.1 deoxyribodipyrimidine photo-lyase [Massilia sp. CFBP 13647]MBD8674555.1 deoxyribodipyrimidine photo-lyase [Massilia sp. CFBP 13721]
MIPISKSLVWLRRDLRAFDHAALHHALADAVQQGGAVYCVFVFDSDILAGLPRDDRRVRFIHASLGELDAELRKLGGGLLVRHGAARACIPRLAAELGAGAVYVNDDYEPDAIARDAAVAEALGRDGRTLLRFKDQVIFEKSEVLTLAGGIYGVFTPYKNAWLKRLNAQPQAAAPWMIEPYAAGFAAVPESPLPSLADLGFDDGPLPAPPGMDGATRLFEDFLPRLADYGTARDFPMQDATSRLSIHLRFGTTSVRHLVRTLRQMMANGAGGAGAPVWLSELVWRDFYAMILFHHPHIAQQAFKPAFDAVAWEAGEHAAALFAAWCAGRTGYPLVDAAMTQLNSTGFMHNRLRMVTASFLVKDLGMDWRWGERYFARQLNDYDLASNVGGWQWAASTGCDAQPWFRIFNPTTQSQKFDRQGAFIRQYLPQLARLDARDIHAPWLVPADELAACGVVLGRDYPAPIVDHAEARQRTLERFAVVKAAQPDSD